MAKWKEVKTLDSQFQTMNQMGWPTDYGQTMNAQLSADYMQSIGNQSAMNAYPYGQPEKPLNGSGIRPVQYMVIVKPDEVEKTTKGGIILPDTKVEKDEFQRMEGLLVAVSPMAFTFKDWPDGAEKPKVGDRVTFARYNATEITGRDGGKYWFMKDESILGVME